MFALAMLLSLTTCDPAGEPTRLSRDQRRESYETIRQTCGDLGVSAHVCEAAVAMAWRESRGVPTVAHTRGLNEFGLGLFAHSPKFWGWLLRPARLGSDGFCDPRMATVALVREFQYAVRRGAIDLRGLQRVHAGHSPRDSRFRARDARWCYLLANGPRDDQGVVSWESADCGRAVTGDDLGERLTDTRIAFLADSPL